MKTINEYIMESSSSTIVNKIKKEFEKEFGNKVTIGSGRANYRQLYDVYIYDDKLVTLDRYPIEFFRFTSRDLQKISK